MFASDLCVLSTVPGARTQLCLVRVLSGSLDLPGSSGCSGEMFLIIFFSLWLCLHRDLSENTIQAIPRKAFRGATDLKNL